MNHESVVAAAADAGDVTLLVNNAGISTGAKLVTGDLGEIRREMDTHFWGTLDVIRQFAPVLAAQGGGAIVNIASVDGLLPCLGTGYDTAKAGAIHFSRSLAVDLAPHGIRVNAVSPGVVPVPTLDKIHSGELDPLWPTDSSVTGLMGPLMKQRSSNVPIGRKGTPTDIAHAVLFLVSDAASYVTGQNLAVDGGWTLI